MPILTLLGADVPLGKLLLGVVEGRIYVLDAYDGKLLAKFSNDTPESGTTPEAAFSFDGKYVLSGELLMPWVHNSCHLGSGGWYSAKGNGAAECIDWHQLLYEYACAQQCFDDLNQQRPANSQVV